jgi:NAD(P)H-quinone oxidoreductase subunit 5
MFDDRLIRVCALVIVGGPALLLAALSLPSLRGQRLSEQATARGCRLANSLGLLAAVIVLITMLCEGSGYRSVQLGDWVIVPDYHLTFRLVFDWLSLPFVILTFLLCGTIAAFATRYMHSEVGYNRFFVLYAIFVAGMVLTALSGTIETLFTGWEMVGLSSALLVAYFQERSAPVRNGLRVWVVYRVSDAALLLAAVVLHHAVGQGNFDLLLGTSPWPMGAVALPENQALLVGLLLLVAAAGKSALVPFSGWLPRAMEGPTPSSAVFYGALSIHLGAYMLLRMSPILDASPTLCGVVVALGLITAAYAYLVGNVQTDIKSALSFASLVQVGIIVAEIGLGLRYLALLHLLGHACLRTLQFIRAPTLLHDYHNLENAIGQHLPRMTGPWNWIRSPRLRAWVYRFALERGQLDAILMSVFVAPFLNVCRRCDALERGWTDLLAGGASRPSDEVKPFSGMVDELP